ncbi:MAG: hypothetical protein Q7R49_00650 [Candidatus Daviesbacteria bacterium]|nr:hypothetical protein [Candidatus Daviesbacteria bacterium]
MVEATKYTLELVGVGFDVERWFGVGAMHQGVRMDDLVLVSLLDESANLQKNKQFQIGFRLLTSQGSDLLGVEFIDPLQAYEFKLQSDLSFRFRTVANLQHPGQTRFAFSRVENIVRG